MIDCFFHWNLPPSTDKELAKADVIVTHEFGDQKTLNNSTRDIVRCAAHLSYKIGKPLICQSPGHELAELLKVHVVGVIDTNLNRTGAYLDTEEVNRQAALISMKFGWKRAVVCTHPHHLWRAGRNIERHGIIPIYADMSTVRYDWNCTRPALRTPWLFIPREILARLVYRKRGFI